MRITKVLLPLLIFALLGATAAWADTADKLNGRWSCDMQASMAGMGEAAQDDFGKAMLEMLLPTMSFEFNVATGKFTSSALGQTETVDFSVVGQTANTVTIKVEGEEQVIELLDDTTMKLDGGDGTFMIFKKS